MNICSYMIKFVRTFDLASHNEGFIRQLVDFFEKKCFVQQNYVSLHLFDESETADVQTFF